MSRRLFAFLAAAGLAASFGLVTAAQSTAAGRSNSDFLQIAVGSTTGRIDILRPRGTDDDDQPRIAQPSRVAGAQSQARGQASLNQYGIQYNGGPVIQQAKVVAIYWGTSPIFANGPTPGTNGAASSDNSLIGYYLSNLGGSPYYTINTSYTNSSGTPISANVSYTGFWADNANVHTGCQSVNDAQMQAEIVAGFNSGKITYDSSTIYAIFSAGQVNLGGGFGNCNGNNFQYCAYHTYFNWNGNIVKYAAMPYNYAYQGSCTAFQGGGPAHGSQDPGADAEVNTLTHEIQEANTDPQLNAWWVSNSQSSYSGEENADMCAWTFGALNPDGKGNITIGGQSWLVQRNWLNTAPSGGCAQTYAGTGPTTGTVSGTVTATTGGAPISGATVQITGGGSATTNGSGVYTIANVAAGSWTVTASAGGFTASSAGSVGVTAGTTTTQNFSLATAPATGTLTGTVTRTSNGTAISGASVSIAGGTSTTTNGSGIYTFSNVAAGTYNVTASGSGFTAATVSGLAVTAGNTTTQNFSLVTAPTTGTLTGTVTNANTAAVISGANVQITGGASTTTNVSGVYTFSNVTAGTYALTVTKSGFSNGTASGLSVTAGNTTTRNFALAPTAGNVPSAPGNLTAKKAGAAQHGVKLNWDPSTANGSAITGYRVYRSTSSGAEVLLTTVGKNATAYADSGTTSNVTYFYEVTAVNANGESAFSGEASAPAR